MRWSDTTRGCTCVLAPVRRMFRPSFAWRLNDVLWPVRGATAAAGFFLGTMRGDRLPNSLFRLAHQSKHPRRRGETGLGVRQLPQICSFALVFVGLAAGLSRRQPGGRNQELA